MRKLRNEQQYLKTSQYNNADKLGARIRLHQQYSTNKQDLWAWFFDKVLVQVPAKANLLECGTGRGDVWKVNASRIPKDWSITLTDFSEGMLADNQAHLGDLAPRMTYRVVDVQDIPFEDNTFDIVLANYMLYHAPDIPLAIRELRRVLKPDGVLFTATNGKNHLAELFRIAHRIDDNTEWQKRFELTFSIESGAALLGDQFAEVRFDRFDCDLFVTEAQPIIDYIASMISLDGKAILQQQGAAIREDLERRIAADGGILIGKETGTFIARGAQPNESTSSGD